MVRSSSFKTYVEVLYARAKYSNTSSGCDFIISTSNIAQSPSLITYCSLGTYRRQLALDTLLRKSTTKYIRFYPEPEVKVFIRRKKHSYLRRCFGNISDSGKKVLPLGSMTVIPAIQVYLCACAGVGAAFGADSVQYCRSQI